MSVSFGLVVFSVGLAGCSLVVYSVALGWYTLNLLYLFFLNSVAAAARPLVMAWQAVVEVLSFCAGVADMVIVGS